MKTVFANHQELCHIWAGQKASSGRAGNMLFDGPSIFSYGRHFEIARVVKPGVVLFTSHGYSVSTAKHKSYTRRAISHCKVFTVETMSDHNRNVDAYLTDIRSGLIGLEKKIYTAYRLHEVGILIKEARAYVAEFRADITKERRELVYGFWRKVDHLIPAKTLKAMKEKEERFRAGQKVRDENRRKAQAARWALYTAERQAREAKEKAFEETTNAALEIWGAEVDALNREAWYLGHDLPRGWRDYDAPVLLRVVGEEIETSQGASVTIESAKDLWAKMRRGEDLKGFRIGYYEVTGIHDGKLVIGCHRIPVREVARMAVTLGLESEAA